ncbi:hypothetical protein [Clostridium kluyveri]|uniref:Uncharacterized protein n=1 Tax=Clostridium kluyveri TaxID=1534 RepID=A0A1L5FEH3_CLOKL|nr:hypothetical protein [Clostridium kluyveri]APM41406.1 hypothetical protein BS101_22135 [Clostridium kluyveri]
MPLHKIPLCNFKYAGDIYSGATFKYETSIKVIKFEQRWLSRQKLNRIKIEKGLNKSLFKSATHISKHNKRYLYKNPYEIASKEYPKELKAKNKEINKSYKIYLERENISLVKSIHVEMERKDILIDKGWNIYLEAEYLNFIKNSTLQLERPNIFINIEVSKNIENDRYNEIYVDGCKNLQGIKDKIINIEENINLTRSWQNGLYKKDILITCSTGHVEDINLLTNVFIEKLRIREFFKSKIGKQISPERVININRIIVTRYARKDLSKHMNMLDLQHAVYRYTLKDIMRSCKINMVRKFNSKRISKSKVAKMAYKISDIDISRFIRNACMYRCNYRNAFKDFNYLFKVNIVPIFKNNSNILVKRDIRKDIYYNIATILSRDEATNINKVFNRYLNNVKFINIYKQIEKELLNVSVIDVFKNESYSLGISFGRELYKEGNHNKFIDVIKRWWWLNPTEPRDSIIIPNKDFSYTQELLNNPYYEYLRFTNHPIGWGNAWGIDWNIPAYAVSIEIMLDLINILIMVWHSNVQGWMCSTGKESMQFIMELLYDWYTLRTSTPNTDYYRTYRWIRWEAEKVYFLNLDTGLQAVGVLTTNLIGHLKNHEFNLVPLWRNPKAMDIERNFNRIAQNGDLIKSLDKVKGKRYYYIETQNVEKKNIFGGGNNGGNS